ncbi:MAG: hypothetical protein H7Z43_06165 [Clostridia bacterium]|nr:hypothetical protein [Deltaproteobacteria bacterium]
MIRRFALMTMFGLLFACPDKKIDPKDSTLERARERTNTNVDHATDSPLNEAARDIKENTNNNADKKH